MVQEQWCDITDGHTDGQMGGRMDSQTDGGYNNIFEKCRDNNFCHSPHFTDARRVVVSYCPLPFQRKARGHSIRLLKLHIYLNHGLKICICFLQNLDIILFKFFTFLT